MVSLLPKNEKFYDLFDQAAQNLHRTAQLLIQLCDEPGGPDSNEALVGAIHELEHRGDDLTRQLIRELIKSFITPMDREDIHAIAGALDDVVDNMDGAATAFRLLRIETVLPEYRRLAELLVRAGHTIVEIFSNLRSPKTRMRAQALVSKLHEIESEGDRVYQQAIARLFNEEHSPIFIMKWRELCDHLESALDASHHVGIQVEMVLLKAA